jgi:hypothetical protein
VPIIVARSRKGILAVEMILGDTLWARPYTSPRDDNLQRRLPAALPTPRRLAAQQLQNLRRRLPAALPTKPCVHNLASSPTRIRSYNGWPIPADARRTNDWRKLRTLELTSAMHYYATPPHTEQLAKVAYCVAHCDSRPTVPEAPGRLSASTDNC